MSFEDSLRLTGSQMCGLGKSPLFSPRYSVVPSGGKFLDEEISKFRTTIASIARGTRGMVGRKSTSTSSKSTSIGEISEVFKILNNKFWERERREYDKHFDAVRKSAQEFQEHLNKICKVKF